MKLFVVVTFLFAAVVAAPHDQSELDFPFRDMFDYMRCVPVQADESSQKHGCQDTWNVYRQGYLDIVTDFENCANSPTANAADA